MAKPATLLSVFLASPSDVTKERESLEPIIRELNYTLGSFLGVRLELIAWETHSYPGVGCDPQAVINEELPNDLDIFIGILSTRFGTPTGRAGSGTEEEFQRAYARFKEHPDQIRMMVYFNDAPPDRMDKIDPVELQRVNLFREQLGEKGVFYRTYNGADQFQSLVRIHLTNQLLTWNRSWGSARPTTIKEASIRSKLDNQKIAVYSVKDTDMGYLELDAVAAENFNSLVESSHSIITATEQFTKDVEAMTKKIHDFNLQKETDSKSRIQFVNQGAEPYEMFVLRTKPEIEIFSEKFPKGMNAYTKAIVLWPQSFATDPARAKATIDLLNSTRDNFNRLVKAVQDARTSFATLPPLTARLIRASRQAAALLDNYISEIHNAISMISETITITHELTLRMREEDTPKAT